MLSLRQFNSPSLFSFTFGRTGENCPCFRVATFSLFLPHSLAVGDTTQTCYLYPYEYESSRVKTVLCSVHPVPVEWIVIPNRS